MAKESLSPEEIEKNWLRFRGLCEKLGERSEVVLAMVDSLGERLVMCPASAKRDFHNAFPGGLIDHSLRVLGNAVRITKAFGWDVPKDSLIISTLFHDIGKVGTPTQDFYVPQTDNYWIEKKGEMYTYNNDVTYMSTPDRSVFLMQHFGVKLTEDEALAIKLNDGFVVNENKPYCLKISNLVFAVMTADYAATMEEKNVSYWQS
jgi:hypothetical protein